MTDHPDSSRHVISERRVSLESAQSIIEAAVRTAEELNLSVAVHVCDPSGVLIAAARMDGAGFASVTVAANKATTSAAWSLPSGAWLETSQPGHAAWGISTLLEGRVVVMPGGVPIFDNGEAIGAVGVSGALPHQDEALSIAALTHCGFAVSI